MSQGSYGPRQSTGKKSTRKQKKTHHRTSMLRSAARLASKAAVPADSAARWAALAATKGSWLAS